MPRPDGLLQRPEAVEGVAPSLGVLIHRHPGGAERRHEVAVPRDNELAWREPEDVLECPGHGGVVRDASLE